MWGLFLILSQTTSRTPPPPPPPPVLLIHKAPPCLLQGHRGDRGDRGENTGTQGGRNWDHQTNHREYGTDLVTIDWERSDTYNNYCLPI